MLVEGVSPKDARRLTGLTRQNKTVNFAGEVGYGWKHGSACG